MLELRHKVLRNLDRYRLAFEAAAAMPIEGLIFQAHHAYGIGFAVWTTRQQDRLAACFTLLNHLNALTRAPWPPSRAVFPLSGKMLKQPWSQVVERLTSNHQRFDRWRFEPFQKAKYETFARSVCNDARGGQCWTAQGLARPAPTLGELVEDDLQTALLVDGNWQSRTLLTTSGTRQMLLVRLLAD